jgi:hypothetical protein
VEGGSRLVREVRGREEARSRVARAGGGSGEVTRGRDARSRACRGRGAGWLDRLVGPLGLGDEYIYIYIYESILSIC